MARGGARVGAGRPKKKSRVREARRPAPSVVVPLAAAPTAAPATSLLEGFRKTEKALEAALEDALEPKEIAAISTTLNRTRWHIGQLTGEATITEAKIIRSDAWKRMLFHVEQVLTKHPEAASEMAAYFESLDQ